MGEFERNGYNYEEKDYPYHLPQKLPEIRNYAASIPINVLSNTPKVQAIEHLKNGILEAVFYDPGTVVTSSGLQVTVDHPAIILLQRKGTQVEISAANPVNKP